MVYAADYNVKQPEDTLNTAPVVAIDNFTILIRLISYVENRRNSGVVFTLMPNVMYKL